MITDPLSTITKEEFSKLKAHFKLNRCFYPGCSESAIKAHSIQESGPLLLISDTIESQGKQVYYLDDELRYITQIESIGSLQKETKELKYSGISGASTFRGFCDDHDKIFTAIETVPFTGSAKQCFLHSYRAFAYNLNQAEAGLGGVPKLGKIISSEVDEGKIVISEKIEKLKNKGVDDLADSLLKSSSEILDSLNNIYNLLGEQAQIGITELNAVQKKHLDKIISEEAFDEMKYCVRSFDAIFPIASSTVLPFLDNLAIPSEDGVRYSASYALSVIPDMKSGKTHFILGVFGDNPNIDIQITKFKKMRTSDFLSCMSDLLIFRGKNTYLSPRIIRKMTPAALKFLIETRLTKEQFMNDVGVANSNINLFDKRFAD